MEERGGKIPVNRRRFIQAVGTSGSAVAFSGMSSASPSHKLRSPEQQKAWKNRQRYNTTGAIQAAVSKFGSDLLVELKHQGLIEQASIAALSTETVLSSKDYREKIANKDGEKPEGSHVGAIKVDETVTAHITVSKNTPNGRVTIHIQPDVGSAHAIYRPDVGEHVVFKDTGDGVSTSELPCSTSCSACEGYCCNYWCVEHQEYEVTCCEYEGCTTGEPCACCPF